MDWLRRPKAILVAKEAERNAQEEEKRLVEERVKKEEEERTARLMAVWEKLQIDRIIEDVRNTVWRDLSISEITKHGRGLQKQIYYRGGGAGDVIEYPRACFSVYLDKESVRLHAEGSLYEDSYLLEAITDTETLQEKVEKLLVDKLQGTRKPKSEPISRIPDDRHR